MKAMILAAGRGERMGKLTINTPKPLLQIARKPMIYTVIEQLSKAGFKEIVINVAYLGEQIIAKVGNGARWGVQIEYSNEGDVGLETAGGILNALPLLGSEPFLVVNADIVCDFPLASLHQQQPTHAHLILVDNPAHHPAGDFSLADTGMLTVTASNRLTFSGIGVYNPELFVNLSQGERRLAPVLRQAMQYALVTGEKHTGCWVDVGTPERLMELNNII